MEPLPDSTVQEEPLAESADAAIDELSPDGSRPDGVTDAVGDSTVDMTGDGNDEEDSGFDFKGGGCSCRMGF